MGGGGQLKGQPQLLLLCAAARHRSNAMTEHSLMHLPYRGILSGVIFNIGRYRYGIFWPLSGPPDMLPIISCILSSNGELLPFCHSYVSNIASGAKD